MRVFIAVPATKEIQSKLATLGGKLTSFGKIKCVAEENIHLTLKFLGELSEEKAGELASALEPLRAGKSFHVCVHGLDAFPKTAFPRVVWAGVSEGSEVLTSLHKKVDGLLKPLGFKEDDRFHHHFTVARVRRVDEQKGLQGFIEDYSSEEFGSYKVSEIALMESRLGSNGPSYSVIEKFSLS